MWDIAVGGHISSGENDLIAVKRELFEELGINPNNYKIEFIKKYKEELFNKGIISKEFVSLYILYLDNELEKFELQEDEVDSVCWVTKDEMELLIKQEKLIPHKEEYKFLREILK
jgi:8-oxo-dGTP pyrophosphatase MutT (NUDIX family)